MHKMNIQIVLTSFPSARSVTVFIDERKLKFEAINAVEIEILKITTQSVNLCLIIFIMFISSGTAVHSNCSIDCFLRVINPLIVI